MSLIAYDSYRLNKSPSSELQVRMTISSACTGQPHVALRAGGVDGERQPDDDAAGGWKSVPVVLPVREGSPGGSIGTADEGHLPCPAVFPAGVR